MKIKGKLVNVSQKNMDIIKDSQIIKDWVDNKYHIKHIFKIPRRDLKGIYTIYLDLEKQKDSLFFKPNNFSENLKLKIYFKMFWIQKEENFRYLVNILFLTFGVIIGLLNYLK